MLNPTPPEHLVNAEGQPYFLWDTEMTLEQLRSGLQDPDPEVRAYLVGKLIRQAKPRVAQSPPPGLKKPGGAGKSQTARPWGLCGPGGLSYR